MARNKKSSQKSQSPSSSSSSQSQSSSQSGILQPPTADQLKRLKEAESAVADYERAHGPSTLSSKSLVVGTDLEAALKRIESFINTANAQQKAAAEHAKTLSDQRARFDLDIKRERAELNAELSQERAKVLGELKELKAREEATLHEQRAQALVDEDEKKKALSAEQKKARAALKERQKELDALVETQRDQLEALNKREGKLNAHELELSAREIKLKEQLVELERLEEAAKTNFVTEHARLLNELREQQEALSDERERFEAEQLDERQALAERVRQAHADQLAQQQAIKTEAREAEATLTQALNARRHEALLEIEKEAAEQQRRFEEERQRALSTLRDELTELERELTQRKRQEELDYRTRSLALSERRASEEEAHINKLAERQRAVDEELLEVREERLNALREELSAQRAEAEAALEREVEERHAALEREDQERREAFRCEVEEQNNLFEERIAELNEREEALNERDEAQALTAKELRKTRVTLETDQELFEEDRAAQEHRVERIVTERTELLRSEFAALQTRFEAVSKERDHYQTQTQALLDFERRFGGREPQEVLHDLKESRRERDELRQQLRERLDTKASERLEQLERERDVRQGELAGERARVRELEAQLSQQRVGATKLEVLQRHNEALEVHKKVLDSAVEELEARVEQLTQQDHKRDPLKSLTELDQDQNLQMPPYVIPPLAKWMRSLEDFTSDLRHRVARGIDGVELFYSERDLRCFLGGLAMTRLLLLQGISGTGKTSLPRAFASAIGAGCEVISVQAGWRDKQDLVGYFNAFHRHFYTQPFLKALYTAGTPAYRDRPFFIILDEMNLSRPEQFFSEFLSALELDPKSRYLTLLNDRLPSAPKLLKDGQSLLIPPNVWFIGTANHDESTVEFADKTYDRAHVMEMPRNTEAAKFTVDHKPERAPISYVELEALFEKNAEAHHRAAIEAQNWLNDAPFAHTLQREFRVGWGNRLEKQLRAYLPTVMAAGGSKGEALDHLLASKLLRKLRDRHDVHAPNLERLKQQLESDWETFDQEHLPERSLELLELEIKVKTGEELI